MPSRQRDSLDLHFMKMAYLASERSTCLRRKVGAVAVKQKRIIATGYNGAVPGAPHCLDIGCIREQLIIPSGQRQEICHASHAEMNVIAQAARFGSSLEGATLFCTTFPCSICSKLLSQSGFVRIVYAVGYPDPLSETIIAVSNILLEQFSMPA